MRDHNVLGYRDDTKSLEVVRVTEFAQIPKGQLSVICQKIAAVRIAPCVPAASDPIVAVCSPAFE